MASDQFFRDAFAARKGKTMRLGSKPRGPPDYRFPSPLRDGVIISRPNRFIMNVIAGGGVLVCHCPTTGRLGDLSLAGLRCLYSTSSKVTRKTAYTVEAVSTSSGNKRSWIGINQTAANRYIEHFLKHGGFPVMATGRLRREVALGRSRIDFLVGNTYIEVKTPLITLPAGNGVKRERKGRFDSFDRLIRHMHKLRRARAAGNRAVILLCYLYDAPPFRAPSRTSTNSKVLATSKAAEMAGVERWQVNLRINKKGVTLIRYFNLLGGGNSPPTISTQVPGFTDSAKG